MLASMPSLKLLFLGGNDEIPESTLARLAEAEWEDFRRPD